MTYSEENYQLPLMMVGAHPDYERDAIDLAGRLGRPTYVKYHIPSGNWYAGTIKREGEEWRQWGPYLPDPK